jgi:ankyrin repeat protein
MVEIALTRVDETAQEYFSSVDIKQKYFPDAQSRIAGTCLAYLSFDFTSAGHCVNDEKMSSRIKTHPLLHYASTQWGHYAASCSTDQMENRVLQFLKDESRLVYASQVLFLHDYDYDEYEGYSKNAHRSPPPLCIVAYFGLRSILDRYDSEEIHKACSRGRQLLHYAAEHERLEIVELLIDRGAAINAIDVDGQSALHLAAAKGHGDVVEKLVKSGAALELRIVKWDERTDRTGATALHLAAIGGHIHIIRILLDGGADIECRNEWHRTPVHLATKSSELATIRVLVERGADIEAEHYLVYLCKSCRDWLVRVAHISAAFASFHQYSKAVRVCY